MPRRAEWGDIARQPRWPFRRAGSLRAAALAATTALAASLPWFTEARPAGGACPPALVETARDVAELRGVSGGLTPTCRVISTVRLRAELDRKLRRDLPLPPEEYLHALVRLGFASGDPRAMYPRLLDFYTRQVLGFYEPATDEMVLVESPAAGEAQASLLWAHELAHAAQEKRFSLPSRLLAMRHDSDRQRAASAIAEGDAMLVMLLLAAPRGQEQTALAAAERMASGAGLPIPAAPGVPEFFVADLLFPYTRGLETVLAAYRRGGWAAVDRLLAAPPNSTAALRNPSRRPPPVTDDQLPPAPDGYREILTDTVGEWALQFWLGRALPAEDATRLAGEWNGDRLRLVEHASDSNRWALAWVIRTRSSAARRLLERALQHAAPRAFSLPEGDVLTPPLLWISTGTTLEVRVNWPASTRQRLPATGVRAPATPP